MRFQTMRDCRRAGPEQRYIWAGLEIFARLPMERREEIRALVGRLAAAPVEGRALFELLTRGATPQSVSARTGVSTARLYALRKSFYEQLPLR